MENPVNPTILDQNDDKEVVIKPVKRQYSEKALVNMRANAKRAREVKLSKVKRKKQIKTALKEVAEKLAKEETIPAETVIQFINDNMKVDHFMKDELHNDLRHDHYASKHNPEVETPQSSKGAEDDTPANKVETTVNQDGPTMLMAPHKQYLSMIDPQATRSGTRVDDGFAIGNRDTLVPTQNLQRRVEQPGMFLDFNKPKLTTNKQGIIFI